MRRLVKGVALTLYWIGLCVLPVGGYILVYTLLVRWLK